MQSVGARLRDGARAGSRSRFRVPRVVGAVREGNGLKRQACTALLLLGAAGAAEAQTTASRPPSFGAAPRANPGAATRQIDIRATVDVGYDTNVFGVGRGFVGAVGRELDEFSVTPSLQLNILQPVGRHSAYINGQIGYDFFARNDQLNRERINLQAGYNLALPLRCDGNLNSSYLRARVNAGDIFALNPDPAFGRNNTFVVRSVGGRVNCNRAIGFSPSVGYTRSEIRNSIPLFQLNDLDSDTYDASIGYARPSLGRVSIYGSYARTGFLRRNRFGFPAFPGDALDGVEVYTAGGRFEREIGSRISGAIAAGYSWVNPRNVFADPFTGSNYSVSLALRPSDRLTVDLLASRAIDVQNTIFATFAVTDVYALNGTYRVTRPLALNFGSSYQQRDFRGNARTPDGALFINSDSFIRAYGGFSYDLNRQLRLTGLVSQSRRNSNVNAFDFRNTSVNLGISYALSR